MNEVYCLLLSTEPLTVLFYACFQCFGHKFAPHIFLAWFRRKCKKIQLFQRSILIRQWSNALSRTGTAKVAMRRSQCWRASRKKASQPRSGLQRPSGRRRHRRRRWSSSRGRGACRQQRSPRRSRSWAARPVLIPRLLLPRRSRGLRQLSAVITTSRGRCIQANPSER